MQKLKKGQEINSYELMDILFDAIELGYQPTVTYPKGNIVISIYESINESSNPYEMLMSMNDNELVCYEFEIKPNYKYVDAIVEYIHDYID